ncbi:hypothetical protein [Bacillus solitudinis]|uniref:hypothetical protein n=1 Tax=Bacillus solitudinis TaxID=2014074 RepID=UPI000C241B64|nr:hypothetical protein [Bacillus solitudinis]
MFYNTGGTYGFALFALFHDSEEIKNSHEAFDVYVNNEYVGKKVLITESEEPEDILSFLKKQGIQQVSDNVVGDHYIIQTEEAERVKQALETYLQNR